MSVKSIVTDDPRRKVIVDLASNMSGADFAEAVARVCGMFPEQHGMVRKSLKERVRCARCRKLDPRARRASGVG
jgi:hypothetical protein